MRKKEGKMREKLNKIMKALTSYKFLTILWFLIGISDLIKGDISRLDYFCVWVLLMLELVDNVIRENRKDRKDRKDRKGDGS